MRFLARLLSAVIPLTLLIGGAADAREWKATQKPSVHRRSAIARPIPEVEPVTSATLCTFAAPALMPGGDPGWAPLSGRS